MLSTHPHCCRRVSRLRGSLRTSVSHIILLVMYLRGTSMTLKQELIQQVSCWLATLYISIFTGWNVGNTLYKHTCGVGNPVHVAQGFAVGCTAIRHCHKEVKQHQHNFSVFVCGWRQTQFACTFTNFLSITTASSQLHLWLEGLLLILTLNASAPVMHACSGENPVHAGNIIAQSKAISTGLVPAAASPLFIVQQVRRSWAAASCFRAHLDPYFCLGRLLFAS